MLAALFHSGNFDQHDVLMAERSLKAYSAGLTAFILVKVLAPGFYARQNTRTPVRIAVIALATNMALNVALVFPLRHAGLALATTLAAALNAALLYRGLRREGVYSPPPGWGRIWLALGVSGGLMAALLFWGAGDVHEWLALGRSDRVIRLVGWIFAGGFVYAASLLAFGLRFRDFRGR